MNAKIEKKIVAALNAKAVSNIKPIQSLWSGYGEIFRAKVVEGDISSVVVKRIKTEVVKSHPRGWGTSLSHERKLKSYEIEQNWYEHYASRCNENSYVPKYFASFSLDGEQFILLEDLNESGYPLRKEALSIEEAKRVLDWFASFHAEFMMDEPIGLWEVGSYWHLGTRPDEFSAMRSGDLKDQAKLIDRKLNQCKFKTIVHGDAKVANFCFSDKIDKVAAVDFQYVGGGCGMKDVAYFLGSCLDGDTCKKFEEELLSNYFFSLKKALMNTEVFELFPQLEEEWRSMYPLACADFSRFLLGWMPDHPKLNNYSEMKVGEALEQLKNESI